MIESARIRDIEVQMRTLQLRNAKIESRNRILASLPSVNYLSKQSKLSGFKCLGTCEWLLRTSIFGSWYTKTASDCISCYGIPGSGKSVLAASVRDYLTTETTASNNILVCYYYCDYADRPSLDVAHVLGSIVKQVLENLPLDHFGDDFKSPYREGQPLPTLVEGSKYLLELIKQFNVLYLVLDGIDELDAESQTQSLSLIDMLITQTSNTVKIFVTSRTEEVRIKHALKIYPAFSLSEVEIDKDIATYVKGEMSNIHAPHPIASNQELREEVTRALVEGAKGM